MEVTMDLWAPEKKGKARGDHGLVLRRGDYTLPLNIIDPSGLTPSDGEFIDLMLEHQPKTSLKEGDIVKLKEVPPYVRSRLNMQRRLIPVFWKVRFIVSAWAFEVHNLAHHYPDSVAGIDHAVAMLESQGQLPEDRYTKAVVYAHAMPHGMWPDTAFWFPRRVLKKVTFREMNPGWPTVLDEAKAPFVGYDDEQIARPFIFDMAPDLYGDGENIGKPFEHEEETVHTMCLLGMEPFLLGDYADGVDPYYFSERKPLIDPEHDIFEKK
jgi:hypothetical protein